MCNQIGRRVKRVDGWAKANGKTKYGDDLSFPNMLYAACRYTDIPCGKIKRVSFANAHDNVEFITFKDVISNGKIGPIRQDAYPIVDDKISFIGDVVAVTASASKERAYQAAEAIHVEYEKTEGVFSPLEAQKDDVLVHPEYKTNLVVHYPLRKGNLEQGFSESDHIIEREYETNFQEHAYLEPETVTAVPDEQVQGITIYGSIQNPFTTRKVVAMYLNLPMNKVNVVPTPMGGSFGGKDDVVNMMACRVALLCWKTQRPVQLTNSREHSLVESYKRHPYYMKYKVGFTKSGKLKAMKIEIVADSGAYSSQSFFVTWRSVVQATGPYEIEHVETDVKAFYTNNVYTAAFRGFGSPQVIFAQESLMDEVAEICSINPHEIRSLNGFKQNSVTASGQILKKHKVTLHEVMKKAIDQSNFEEKIQQKDQNERFKKGIGMAISYRGCSLGAEGTDASSAIVSVQADGSVYVMTAVNENGQGLQTTFSLIAAEILGITTNEIVFIQPPTRHISDGGPTVASRSTLMGGKAVEQAAEIVKLRILSILKKENPNLNEKEVVWANGKILHKDFEITFAEAAEKAYWAGENLSAYGWYKAPDVSWEEETGQGDAYFTYVYGCHIAEIIVDTITGKITTDALTAVHDVGKVIHRVGAEGQIYGGSLQGLGYGIFEDFSTKNGIVKSKNFDQYLIPTIKDMPETKALFIEGNDPYGPFGAKSLGEPTLELTAAAINNAYANAVGKRNYKIPLTLEQVRLGKPLHKPSRGSESNIKFHKQKYRMPKIKYYRPKNWKEVVDLKSKFNAKILAGGTDLLIQFRHETEEQNLISLENILETKNIAVKENDIHIGASVTISEILAHKSIQTHFPLLAEAMKTLGSNQIRNRATMAGNIVNSAPCADSIPPLLAYNAKIELRGKTNRTLPLSEFLIGTYKTQLQFDEVVASIILPIPTGKQTVFYEQVGRRNAVNITRLSLSMLKLENGNETSYRIVPGSLLAPPRRLEKIEKLLYEKAVNEKTIANWAKENIPERWSSVYKVPVFTALLLYGLEKIK